MHGKDLPSAQRASRGFPFASAGNATSAMAEIVGGIASGELCPGEAQDLGRLVEAFARTIEVRELEDRVMALEKELRMRAG